MYSEAKILKLNLLLIIFTTNLHNIKKITCSSDELLTLFEIILYSCYLLILSFDKVK